MKNKTAIIGVMLLVAAMAAKTYAQAPADEAKPAAAGDAVPQTAPAVADTPQKAAVPDPAAAQIAQLNPGMYQFEETDVQFTTDEDGFNGTGVYKLQLDIKADSTFTMTGYVTAADAGLTNQPIFKVRGYWKQDGEKLIASDMLEQYYDFDSKTFSPWEPPEDNQVMETVKIRNVTDTTFQEYDKETGSWMTWSRM
jgi:hypothetical protein